MAFSHQSSVTFDLKFDLAPLLLDDSIKIIMSIIPTKLAIMAEKSIFSQSSVTFDHEIFFLLSCYLKICGHSLLFLLPIYISIGQILAEVIAGIWH